MSVKQLSTITVLGDGFFILLLEFFILIITIIKIIYLPLHHEKILFPIL